MPDPFTEIREALKTSLLHRPELDHDPASFADFTGSGLCEPNCEGCAALAAVARLEREAAEREGREYDLRNEAVGLHKALRKETERVREVEAELGRLKEGVERDRVVAAERDYSKALEATVTRQAEELRLHAAILRRIEVLGFDRWKDHDLAALRAVLASLEANSKPTPSDDLDLEITSPESSMNANHLLSLFARRYGSMGGQRFPFRLRFQPPVKVIRLHVYETHDGLKGHADNCWCRGA